jgi:D-alanyl-D-alanine carboxypeptidase/D-alanyl-D-alanine-endopeptidase (penicillin-binding protein 4)
MVSPRNTSSETILCFANGIELNCYKYKKTLKKILIFFICSLFFSGCKVKKVKDNLPVLPAHAHTGILIYDTKSGKDVYAYQADKPFVPASNTKLLSLYASLEMLGERLPALRYFERNDTLFVLGTGDPTLLHPDFPENPALSLLKEAQVIVFSDQNFYQSALGAGWSWDDYNDYYQAELSPLPLYGNVVRVEGKTIQPRYWAPQFSQGSGRQVQRHWEENRFSWPGEVRRQEVPFKTGGALSAALLADTLKKKVEYKKFVIDRPLETAWGLPKDTVLRKMMQQSDNLLAEQLLLLAGGSDSISTERSIGKVKEKLLQGFPESYVWKDGSGLSRYNLFTPGFFVHLLKKMQESYSQDRLFSLMSIGGQAGTLRNKYKAERPYVFAKTGSMSGVYNESGYLLSEGGNVLIYSVMKNNFTGPVSENGRATMEWVDAFRKYYSSVTEAAPKP